MSKSNLLENHLKEKRGRKPIEDTDSKKTTVFIGIPNHVIKKHGGDKQIKQVILKKLEE